MNVEDFVSTDGRYYGRYDAWGWFFVGIGDSQVRYIDRWQAADELGVTFVGAP